MVCIKALFLLLCPWWGLFEMKNVFNFILAVIFMELGLYLFFGSDLSMDNMLKNLNNYKDTELPGYGTEVDLYVIDIGEVFLENESITNIMYETERYYIAQINDGRFIVIKTSKDSKKDELISEYAKKCKDFYFFNKGVKPEILYLDGEIDKEPYLEDGDFKGQIEKGLNKYMPERRYVRVDMSDIVVNVDHDADGKSMDSILNQSVKLITSAANTLKKCLGVIVLIIGAVMIISFIKDFLRGISFAGGGKDVIVAGDDVFKNIAVMKNNMHSDIDKNNPEESGRKE